MIIVANWKSNIPQNISEFLEIKKKNFILAPPYTHINHLKGLTLASQDFSLEKGTSRITLDLLQDLKIKYCVIGHVEVNEARENVYKKMDMLIKNNIKPIVCTTDPLGEAHIFNGSGAIVAYEPKENIGASAAINIEKLKEVALNFRNTLDNELLYGGSISIENYRELMVPFLSGFLIGRASLSFSKLIEILEGCDT